MALLSSALPGDAAHGHLRRALKNTSSIKTTTLHGKPLLRKLGGALLSTEEDKQDASLEKTSWPELLGKTGEEAKIVILRENPNINEIQILSGLSPVTRDYRIDRVRIWVDENDIVVTMPFIG